MGAHGTAGITTITLKFRPALAADMILCAMASPGVSASRGTQFENIAHLLDSPQADPQSLWICWPRELDDATMRIKWCQYPLTHTASQLANPL